MLRFTALSPKAPVVPATEKPLAKPADRRSCLDRKPTLGKPAHLQAERLAVPPERGDEAARRNPARAVQSAAHRRHPEIEMKEGPLADERLHAGAGKPCAEPRAQDVDEARMGGDVAQMGIVAAGQGLIDDRQPGERFRTGVIEPLRDGTVQEPEEIHALRRPPPVARRGAPAMAAAVDRRVTPACPPADVAHLDDPHGGRHDRGHRSRHPGGPARARTGLHRSTPARALRRDRPPSPRTRRRRRRSSAPAGRAPRARRRAARSATAYAFRARPPRPRCACRSTRARRKRARRRHGGRHR